VSVLQRIRSSIAAPDRADTTRAIALAAAGALHVVAIALLVSGTGRAMLHRSIEPESIARIILLRPEPPQRPFIPQSAPSEPVPAGPTRGPPPSAATAPRDGSAGTSTAITLPPIDWQREAAISARRFVESEDARQQEFDLSGKREAAARRGAADDARHPSFGWSNQRRVQLEDGVPVLKLGEQCVLVAFLIPACAFGRVEARGDLFDAMVAPAEAGDWKTTQ
jgi:hypothetical protein